MIKDIENKNVNMVIVKDSSRLGRDYIQFGEYIEKYFPQNQVRVVSILDNYDSEIDNGVADTLPFRAVMNDNYAKDTSKKVRSTKLKNAKQGLFMGRYASFGYEKSKEDKHKLVINEEQAKIVRKIYDLFLEGNSPLQISYILVNEKIPTPSQIMNMQKQTPIWHPEVIRRILQNEMYIGNMVQCKKKKVNYKFKKVVDMPKENWAIVENTHEPIIEKEKFYAVQQILKSKEKTRVKSVNLLLKGIVVCKECGKKMGTTVDSRGNHTRYLRCSSYATAPLQRICTPHIINYNNLESAVLKEVTNICEKYLDKIKLKEIIDIENQEIDKQNQIKKENITTYMLTTLIDKIEIDNDKNVTIYYKFSPLNDLS